MVWRKGAAPKAFKRTLELKSCKDLVSRTIKKTTRVGASSMLPRSRGALWRRSSLERKPEHPRKAYLVMQTFLSCFREKEYKKSGGGVVPPQSECQQWGLFEHSCSAWDMSKTKMWDECQREQMMVISQSQLTGVSNWRYSLVLSCKSFLERVELRLPGWYSGLSVPVLVSTQVMIVGNEIEPCTGLKHSTESA